MLLANGCAGSHIEISFYLPGCNSNKYCQQRPVDVVQCWASCQCYQEHYPTMLGTGGSFSICCCRSLRRSWVKWLLQSAQLQNLSTSNGVTWFEAFYHWLCNWHIFLLMHDMKGSQTPLKRFYLKSRLAISPANSKSHDCCWPTNKVQSAFWDAIFLLDRGKFLALNLGPECLPYL